MKRTISLSLFLIFSNLGFCQITTTRVAEAKKTEPELYDSLSNFLGEDYKKYKGQSLFLLPKSEDLQKYGYDGFIFDMNKRSTDESNIYACCDSYNSKYQVLQGRYFSVIDVFEDPSSSFSSDAFLKIKIDGTDEVLFYKYSTRYSSSFPFLVVGYFEKQKQFYVGKEFLTRSFDEKYTDINNGDEIIMKKGEYVKCLDLTIDERNYQPSLVFETEEGHKFLSSLMLMDLRSDKVLTKQQAESYRKKFGDGNWNTILEGKIKVGFTEEMAIVSWGEPDKINRASYGDQWVYGNQYLYFKNGKLISFN
ncbi:hypothetical protein [Cyclobacterium sp.]|uniref:hypothetical protein n=1 Tax=Cyclobacterium sp. TaxID=1966343 RepID=UPI0019C2E1BB|nr:hypothetical protein [Cyclobacterium sp.]MBD3627575.1 hypothetical protein [Cyclobacterium sp.]